MTRADGEFQSAKVFMPFQPDAAGKLRVEVKHPLRTGAVIMAS